MGDQKCFASMLGARMGGSGCLSLPKTAWLTDHSFEDGAEANGVMNGVEAAGKRAGGLALSVATVCRTMA